MNYNKQIKHLWGIPSYRLRLLFFVVLGTTAILASLLIQDAYWRDLLSNFAVTFAAVGVIDFMWDILGGEPMEAKMIDLFADVNQQTDTLNQSIKDAFVDVNQRIDGLNRSLSVAADLTNSNIGIERVWPTRNDWELDRSDGPETWKKRICQAKQVDIISNTFRTWTYDNNFWDEFLESIKRGAKFRLLIYEPDSDVAKIRSKNEKDATSKETSEMALEINKTLDILAEKLSQLDKNVRENVEIRLNAEYYHTTQLIRADERILVALYRSDKSGSYSPTLQITGPNSSWFIAYTGQFGPLWEAGKPLKIKALKITSN